jgi:hypothetical protein
MRPRIKRSVSGLRAHQEEIRLATEIVDRRERYRIIRP